MQTKTFLFTIDDRRFRARKSDWARWLSTFAASVVTLLVIPVTAEARRVRAVLDPTDPGRTLFPTDRFTVPDQNQITGCRILLPLPDCTKYPSDCEDLEQINKLDGFSLRPRLTIPFDGPIDPRTVNSNSVFVIPLSSRHGSPRSIGVDQIIWNGTQNTAYANPVDLLDQYSRYAVIVTDGVRDSNGTPVLPSRGFRRTAVRDRNVAEALWAAERAGIPVANVVSAAVFTTQSATPVLERIRDQLKAATPERARFDLGANGARTVFPRADITRFTWAQQTRSNPDGFNEVSIALPTQAEGVQTVAFGRYRSPDYRVHPGEFIPAIATRNGVPAVGGMNDVYMNLYLPAGQKPAAGWPIAILGHGGGAHKGTLLPFVAALASHGIATILINAAGHGFGEKGAYTILRNDNTAITFPAGGRGFDQNSDGTISDREGIRSVGPHTIFDDRDGFRQTAIDLMQLVRVIETGVDVDADGSSDLNGSRIYYLGASLGSNYGAILVAVEPSIRAAVLGVPPGTRTGRRWSGIGDRNHYGVMLASRQPSLVNGPGVTHLSDVPVATAPLFNDNTPLPMGAPLSVRLEDGRTETIMSPVMDRVPGAFEIQTFFDRAEWAMQSGDATAYAPYIRKQPLNGVPPKAILIQFARGDQAAPNPGTSALLQAGELEPWAMFYRHDMAFAENPGLPKNPHGFVPLTANFGAIARGGQEQAAVFLESDGTKIIHPEPSRFFEVPVSRPLPSTLGYIP